MTPADAVPDEAAGLLDFWFGAPESPVHGTNRPEWFRKDEAFDALIRERYGALLERGLRGELSGWAATQFGALAHVVLLDQFPRNAFRGTPRAFAGDARALAAQAPEMAESLDYAERHRTIIERFGRFPHRNAILGRASTAEELEFLQQPGSGF